MRFEQIYNWIEANKPETILEIGTWNGQNALRMLKDGAKRYIGFDLFDEATEITDELENNVKKHFTLEEVQAVLKAHNAELIQGNTRETLKVYAAGKQPFVDMAVIDGGHSKGTIKSDLLTVFKIMRRNGVVFLDDYYYDCPVKNMGAQSILAECNIPYTVLPKAERTKGGYLVKIARVDMKDVPSLGHYNVPTEKAWSFAPPEAA